MSDPTQIHPEGFEREAEAAASPPSPRQRLVELLAQDVTPQVESAARQLIAESGPFRAEDLQGRLLEVAQHGHRHLQQRNGRDRHGDA